MVKVNNLIMDTCKFITILLLYCVCAAYCYPSKPLNERSPELTWQAWLLVDDQNQNQSKQQTHSDGALRRRITPKSVFIAPTFSPDSLPPCADGYSSDHMGRCIQIIKLNESAHREFIIEKLKEKFGPFDYEDEVEEETPTQGPFQINIPLAVDEDESEEDTDIAIIVSPTKMFAENSGISLDKRDSIDDEKKQEMFLKKLAEATTKKNDESTAAAEQSTTLLNNEEIGTLMDDLTPITEPLTTVDFITSTDSRNVKRSTTDSDEVTTTSEDLPAFTTDSSTTTYGEVTTLAPKIITTQSSGFRFPEESKRHTLIKFPDSDVSFPTQIPSSVEPIPNIRDVSKHFNDQPLYKLPDSPVNDGKIVFKDEPHLEVANLDYSNGVQTQIAPTTTHRVFNRRNRDKHNSMFLLPPRWSEPNFQKPLILRFSRKHAYLDENQFKNPDYYRSIPMDDFAYLFKFKHKQSSHR